MKKKLLLTTMIAFAFMFACALFIQPNYAEAKSHSHKYTTVVSQKNPGCTEYGYVKRKCSCGATKVTEWIYPLGHNYESKYVQKNATCTSTGRFVQTCSRCGSKKYTTINQIGHTYVKKSGVYVCKYCGKKK